MNVRGLANPQPAKGEFIMSYSHEVEIKEKLEERKLKGKNYGVSWSIVPCVTVDGRYVSLVTAEKQGEAARSQYTLVRDDLQSAISDGAWQLNEYIELMGVSDVS